MKYEYKILPTQGLHFSEIELQINRLGTEGWELIAVLANSLTVNHYFKRAI